MPGKSNPADILSRGCLADKLVSCNYLLNGPLWLEEENINFDDLKLVCPLTDTELLATYSSECRYTSLVSLTTLSLVFDINRYSSLKKAIRVMAIILRWKSKVRGPFLSAELKSAENKIIYFEQRFSFPQEIAAIKSGNLLPKSSSIKSLSPILDPKGFLRVGGRINYSEISHDACNPLIIPHGKFSYLLMEFHHYFYKHCGAGIMLSNLRDQYWIIKARRTAKSVIKSCKRCQ